MLQKHRGAVRRFSWLLRFSAWLQALPGKLTPPPFRLMQIESAFWQSRLLYTAARLDIATVLGDEALEAEELARRVAADPDAIYRLLRMLVAMGVFKALSPRTFGNNPVSAYLREDHPNSLRAMVLMHNSEVMSRPWYEGLEQGVRTGEPPFELIHGEALFRYMDRDANFDALFARAMESVEALVGDSFVTDFDWGQFDRVIDVGGSKGAKALAILKHHPGLRALVVDREQTIRGASDYWRAREDGSLLARLQFQAGDVLESVPPAESDRDIFLLVAVLHGFDDETAVRALRNVARAAKGAGATIAVMEMVLPASDADLTMLSFDMQMFVNTRGRERTLEEWKTLFSRADLALTEVVGLRSFGKILVLRARS